DGICPGPLAETPQGLLPTLADSLRANSPPPARLGRRNPVQVDGSEHGPLAIGQEVEQLGYVWPSVQVRLDHSVQGDRSKAIGADPSEAEPLLHMQLPGRHRPTPVDGGGRELKAQRWIALLRRDDQAEVCRGDRVIAPLAAESAEVPIDCEDGQL